MACKIKHITTLLVLCVVFTACLSDEEYYSSIDSVRLRQISESFTEMDIEGYRCLGESCYAYDSLNARIDIPGGVNELITSAKDKDDICEGDNFYEMEFLFTRCGDTHEREFTKYIFPGSVNEVDENILRFLRPVHNDNVVVFEYR